MKVADLDGDSNLDIVASSSDSLNLLYGDGSGALSNRQAIVGAYINTSVVAGNFGGDGCLDLAVLDSSLHHLSIYTSSNCTYAGAQAIAIADGALSVAAADFDEDGKADFAVANGNADSFTIFRGDGQGGVLDAGITYKLKGKPFFATTADVDNDGHADLVLLTGKSHKVLIYFGLGNGSFARPVSRAVGSDPRFVTIGDLDGDGALDLATANLGNDTVSALVQDRPRHFRAKKYHSGYGTIAVAIGDVNQDGYPDLITADYYGMSITILAGQLTRKFVYLTSYDVGGRPYTVALGDFDNDGQPDVVTGNYSADSETILLNRTNTP